jgi:hypothetical protein
MGWLESLETVASVLSGPPYLGSRRSARPLPDESQDQFTLRAGVLPVMMFPAFGWLAVRAAMYFQGRLAWTFAVVAIAVLLYGIGRYLQVLCRVLRGRSTPRM